MRPTARRQSHPWWRRQAISSAPTVRPTLVLSHTWLAGREEEMTHTNHRRGTMESLATDYIFVTMAARGFNVEGTAPHMKKFYEIVMHHNPTFVGDAAKGNQLTIGIKAMLEE